MRCLLGGALMGLANLVPGVSGGTMLVATGIYTRFIDAVSDATRLRLTRTMVLTLGSVVLGALVAIPALAGVIHWALVEFRWAMFALFIGLTLGGVPILWAMARPMGPGTRWGAVGGVVAMGGLVALQESGAGGGSGDGVVLLVVGGAAAASAMILPGVSGAFLLLLLGIYETVIAAIKDGVTAVKDATWPRWWISWGSLSRSGSGCSSGWSGWRTCCAGCFIGTNARPLVSCSG